MVVDRAPVGRRATIGRGPTDERLAFIMVGLPARGKTYIARKIGRYLDWLGYRARVFNVGDYRRQRLGAHHPSSFFDPDNEHGRKQRRQMAQAALHDMLHWLELGGELAIYDATNTTRERRANLRDACEAAGVRVVYVESICEDPDLIEANIRATKLQSPDYEGVDPNVAVDDFRARIAHYERVYEPITSDEVTYIKYVDVGRRIVVNRIQGYVPGKVLFFLMNTHLIPRPIYFTRHGESSFNIENRIGGDAELTPAGVRYSRQLADFLTQRLDSGVTPTVLTSTLRRTIDTASTLPWPSTPWKLLDEIDAGVCNGLTYDQIASRLPNEFAARTADKFNYRYPNGESYRDVIGRVDPLIIELERRQSPVVVVAHQAVLRVLYAYFMDKPAQDCPYLPVPLNTVIELTPGPYGYQEQRHELLVRPARFGNETT